MRGSALSTTASRAAALERLGAFAPRAGRAYEKHRNHDLGPGRREAVSGLSAAIRHRLILEQEVAAAAIAACGLPAAEKFVQEVCWRTYWKGWLEMRPRVWESYRRDVESLLAEAPRPLLRSVERATAGETGLECFDAWARELTDTGYLHNHARMWFASLWMFTLRLPWQLGADFFLRHLLDGDPASNTLSWRWVGGLHTPGKTYLARADNIARYTGGRFRPDPSSLAREALPLEEEERFSVEGLSAAGAPPRDHALGILVTEEDCAPETLLEGGERVVAVAAATAPEARSPLQVASAVRRFTEDAVDDALARAGAAFGAPAERLADLELDLPAWAEARGVRHIVTAHVPVGPMRERIDALQPTLARRGIELHRVRREWDSAFWPHARRGYFRLKRSIGEILGRTALGGAGNGAGSDRRDPAKRVAAGPPR